MVSNVKFGIRVKSPSDMNEKDFPRGVKSEIFDSHKYRLSKLIIALTGDLINKSHSKKIRAIILELSHTNIIDVIVLQPEKMVTIYNAYVSKQHPMKYLLLDGETVTALFKG